MKSTMKQNSPRMFYGRDVTDVVRTNAGYEIQNRKTGEAINLSLHDIQLIFWNFKFVRDGLGFTTAKCINYQQANSTDLSYGEWDDEREVKDPE